MRWKRKSTGWMRHCRHRDELNPEIFVRYDECKQLLSDAMEKWEREHEELEKWKTKLAENE